MSSIERINEQQGLSGKGFARLRNKLKEIVFEAHTPAGRLFDLMLLWLIGLSVLIVMLESVTVVRLKYGFWLLLAEWVLTLLFTLEYLLRVLLIKRPLRYVFSFYGIIDLLSVLPTYLSLFVLGAQSLLVIRVLRFLRVFRVLKFSRYSSESRVLMRALLASRHKIFVFLFTVTTLIIIIGTLMYLIEGEENGFTSIPLSIYWSVVTITTVGYGDIAPQTDLGKLLATLTMIIGYAILAVPTGIVSHELMTQDKLTDNTRICDECLKEGHAARANFCYNCGAALRKPTTEDFSA